MWFRPGLPRVAVVVAVGLTVVLAGTSCGSQGMRRPPNNQASPPSRPSQPVRITTSTTTVLTAQGRLRGTASDGVTSFQGVPYAAPPVGALRWHAPVAPTAWKGIRPATRPGAACAQPEVKDSSEDCLYLNVTTPSVVGKRPVVVWLHGGAFSSGYGAQYDASRMAEQGDVTVVTVNSRLGAFGFFAHPDLPNSGAYGLQDQQAALRWVHANAAAFGGDADNITLMGESSGGASVCAQLTSPGAAGLFQRAVIESGSCLQNWPKNMLAPGDPAAAYWEPVRQLAAKGRGALGCRTLECLRGKPVKDVLSLNGAFHQPAYGTSVLPKSPSQALADGSFHRMPVLQGNTRDEHRLFAALFTLDQPPITADRYRTLLTETFGEPPAARVFEEYPPGASPALAWAAVGTDRGWVCPTLAADRLLAKRVPVYSFEFADEHPPAPDLRPDFPLGAYHSSELPYLFGMGDVRLKAGHARLSTRMIAAWTTFARTGTPGGTWQPFPTTLQLTPAGDKVVNAATDHRCAFWTQIDQTRRT